MLERSELRSVSRMHFIDDIYKEYRKYTPYSIVINNYA